MAGLHTSAEARGGRRPPERGRAERTVPPRRNAPVRPRRQTEPRELGPPDAGTVVEVRVAGRAIPVTVGRLEDGMLWLRLSEAVRGGARLTLAWGTPAGARETTVDALTHTGQDGLLCRVGQTRAVDRRRYERVRPSRRVFVRALTLAPDDGEPGETLLGEVADISFGGVCFRTAGAPRYGQPLLLTFRDRDGEIGEPVPAKILHVTAESTATRLVACAFGRVGLVAATIRDVIMGPAVAEPPDLPR